MRKLALLLPLFLGLATPAFAACPANTGNALTTGTDDQVIRDALVEVCGVGLGVGVTTADFDAKIGSVTETAPATDTASSGLNGRLQRLAQRITSLIELMPTALGTGGGLKVDGSGTALPVSGTVTANATLAAETTKVIGTVNVAASQTIATTNAGTFAVQAAQSGTWTVQPGNTANTTPWLVTLQPTTSGGSSTYSGNVTTAGSGAGTGGVAVDASPGQMYGYAVYNGNSSVCYMSFFDQTQALTNLGTTVPKLAIGIPANGGANVSFANGIPFATAITVSATTTRNGSTACSTGLDINVLYK